MNFAQAVPYESAGQGPFSVWALINDDGQNDYDYGVSGDVTFLQTLLMAKINGLNH